MKPDKLQLMQEANRRGILPPEKKALFQEAVKRGLIVDNDSMEQPEIAQDQPKMSRGEALLTTGTNVPFAPRIKAGIAAGIAAPFVEDRSLKELYGEALESERAKLGQAREQYPVQSFVSQLPADIAVGGQLLKGAGLAGKGIKSAMAGAGGLSALQSAGESKELLSLETAANALGSGLLGAGTSGLLGGGAKGYQALFNKNAGAAVKRMTADEVKGLASAAYKTATEKGGIVKPEFINTLVNKAGEFDKQTAIGQALAGKSPISEVKEVLGSFQGKKLDLSSLQELDEVLADRIDDYVENGVIKKAGLPLLKLQNSLRDMVEKAGSEMIEGGKEGFEALKQGRALWAKAAKLRDVEKIITRAEMSDNPATALKTGFRTLFNNPNRLKYFNGEEKKLIKGAAQSGVISDTLRTFGSRLIPIGSIVAGGGIPSAMAGQAASMASRNLATRAQLSKAEKVAQQILGNRAQATPQSISPMNPILAARLASQSTYQP